MELNLTNFAAMLQVNYDVAKLKDAVYKRNPGYALMPKNENATGEEIHLPITFSVSKGVSADFDTAQGNKDSDSQYDKFVTTLADWFSLADISNKLMAVSKGHSFAEASVRAVDAAVRALTLKAGADIYISSVGVRSVSAASPPAGTGVATKVLYVGSTVRRWEVGWNVQFKNPAGGLRTAGASLKISAIDRGAGTLTFTTVGASIVADIADAVDGDELILDGDYNGCINGLPDWIPDTAPTATPFLGVDRTQDITRLSGQRLDATGMTYQEALMHLATLCTIEDMAPDLFLCNPMDVHRLRLEMMNSLERSVVRSPDREHITFRSLVLPTDSGQDVQIVGDRNIEEGRGYMCTTDSLVLMSAGPAIAVIQTDGLPYLRLPTKNSVEVRIGGYPQFGCFAPGANGVVTGLGS